MAAIAYTVAFDGVEARLVEVQCSVSPGLPGFGIVGLPDKSVSDDYARTLTAAIARPAARDESSARRAIAQPAPIGVNTNRAPVAAG